MSFGFQYKGPSDVVFAGGGWQNMVSTHNLVLYALLGFID